MPDTDDLKQKVELDTSGPAMDVDVPETVEENLIEEKETPVEEPTVRPVTQETEVKTESVVEEKKDDKELEQYSDSVQKRIAKLTKKWREAERQKDEALTYAQSQMKAKKEVEAKLSKIEPNFLKTSEESITSGVEAAKAKLAAAREANDLTAEAEAMQAISELGVKKARLEEAKLARENLEKQPAKPEVNLTRQPRAQAPDPKAEAWSERNTWFGQETLEKQQVGSTCGLVLAQGPDCYKDKDRYPEGPWCKTGDWVIFARYAGSRIQIDGGEVRLLNDDEVLATIDNPEDILHQY